MFGYGPAFSQPYVRFSSDLSELTVTAVKLDVVARTQLEIELLPGLRKTGTQLAASDKLPSIGRVEWWMDESNLEKLFIPATSRWSLKDIRFSRHGRKTLLNVFLKMLSIRRHSESFGRESFDPEWYIKTSLSSNTGNIKQLETLDFADFQIELEGCLPSRTVIETEQFLGLAPDVTEPGDVICALPGCRPLVILRPHDSRSYTFIGDVFLSSDVPGKDFLCSDDFSKLEVHEIVLV